MNFQSLLKRIFRYREIDHTDGRPYLTRYFILFKKRPVWVPFNVFLHHFHSSDDDRALHDHPWGWWASFILCGGYWEHTLDGSKKWHRAGSFRLNKALTLHRVSLDRDLAKVSTWTLFFVGERVREWGFMENGKNWVEYRTYLNLPSDHVSSED